MLRKNGQRRIDGPYHCSGVLAVEGRDRLCCCVRVSVLLEVDQAAREDEDVSGGGSKESVCSKNKEPTLMCYKVHADFHCLYKIRTQKRLPLLKKRTLFTVKARGVTVSDC
jgi:hypothetical protein